MLVCDASGSMQGAPIAALNFFVQEALPHLRQRAAEHPDVDVRIEALAYSDDARWLTPGPTPLAEFRWEPLAAEGLSALGQALRRLGARLGRGDLPLSPPPLLVLLGDAAPTDDWPRALDELSAAPGFDASLRAVVGFGPDVAFDLIEGFLGQSAPVIRSRGAARAWFPAPRPGGFAPVPGRLDHPEALVNALGW